MSRIMLVNGSMHENGSLYTALSEVQKQLEKEGIETKMIFPAAEQMHDCVNCGHCRSGNGCVFGGLVNEAAVELERCDGIVVGSPVYYAGPTGAVCSFLDRLFYSSGRKMTGKLAASVVTCRRGGATAAFERLNQYYLMNNMVVVGSQYWNQVHGCSPDQIRQDEEGLQTMRTLASNIAFLCRSRAAAQEAGVKEPVYEAHVMTNFIR